MEEKAYRLRKIIDDLGHTHTLFAQKIGIGQSYLAQIVTGNKDLSGQVLEKIANLYGDKYNIGWLITGKGEMLLETKGMTLEEKIDQLPVVRAGIVDGKLLDRIDNLEREVMLLKIKYESLKNS